MMNSGKDRCEEFFSKMGSAIRRLWRDAHCDEAAFAEIAYRVLKENPPSENVSIFDVIEFAFFAESFPYQPDLEATFGQPPLTVYYNDDFRIEILFWLEGLPGIHQHSFSGAFHVLHGSSLHSEWNFECVGRVNARLLVGDLTCTRIEMLRCGDTRFIRAGRDFLHATFHLDRPTASVVVRTNREPAHLPQYLYYPPTIAIVPNPKAPATRRRSQLLRMLSSINHPTYLTELMVRYFQVADVLETFYALDDVLPLVRIPGDRECLYKLLETRFPEIIWRVWRAFERKERLGRMSSFRSGLKSDALRFFAAVLMMAPDRDSALALIANRYPDCDPVGQTYRWARALMAELSGGMREEWSETIVGLMDDASAKEVLAAELNSTRKV